MEQETYLERIKKLKSTRKITNDRLSEMTGIPLGTLSKLLAGISDSPKLSNIVAISRALDCSLDWLITGLPENTHNYTLEPEEMTLVESYRELDSYGRALTLAVMDMERTRAERQADEEAIKLHDVARRTARRGGARLRRPEEGSETDTAAEPDSEAATDGETETDTAAETKPAETKPAETEAVTHAPRYDYFEADVKADVTLDKADYTHMQLTLPASLQITHEAVMDYIGRILFQNRTAVNGTTQVTEGISAGMGIDIKSLIMGALGGKLAAAANDAPAQVVVVPQQVESNDEPVEV